GGCCACRSGANDDEVVGHKEVSKGLCLFLSGFQTYLDRGKESRKKVFVCEKPNVMDRQFTGRRKSKGIK
ncbi:MAG: hypothetical protein O7G87_22660, partial [bacterium]|nr:hypothetical protein [bacterium]